MRRLWYRAGRAGSHLCPCRQCRWNWFQGFGSANRIQNMSLSLRGCSGTGSVIFDICLVLILKQGLDAVSWLTNSVLCVALWSKHKILNPFLPLPVQEAAGGNTSLWWEANISFLGWSFYHHMALVGAVTTHAVEGLVIQSTASAESDFLITQVCLQCGFL